MRRRGPSMEMLNQLIREVSLAERVAQLAQADDELASELPVREEQVVPERREVVHEVAVHQQVVQQGRVHQLGLDAQRDQDGGLEDEGERGEGLAISNFSFSNLPAHNFKLFEGVELWK